MNITSNQDLQKLSVGIILFAILFSGLLITHLGLNGIYVIIGTIASLLVFLNPYGGSLIIVIGYPFMVGFSEGVDVVEQAFILLFGLWVIGWLARLLLDRSGKLKFSWHPVSKPTLAVGTLLATGSIIGLLNGASFIDMFRDFSQYAGYLVMFPVLGVVRSRKAAWGILIIIFLIGLPAYIWSSFVWWARKFGLEYGALSLTRVGAAYWGPVMGALWPFALLNTGRRKRLLAGCALLLLLFMSLGSGYRNQLVSMLVMTCVAIWGIWTVQSGKRKMVVAIPIIIGALFLFWVVGGTLGYLPLPGGDKTRFHYSTLLSPSVLLSDISVQGRLVEAQAALKVFQDYPLLGQGLGHHLELDWKWGTWFEKAFSQHLWPTEMLMKFGVAGAFVFIWYFISILRFTYSTARKTNDPIIKAIALGVFIWIITTLVPAVGSFSDRGFTFMVGLMMGILPALSGRHPYAPEKATAANLLPRSKYRKFE